MPCEATLAKHTSHSRRPECLWVQATLAEKQVLLLVRLLCPAMQPVQEAMIQHLAEGAIDVQKGLQHAQADSGEDGEPFD